MERIFICKGGHFLLRDKAAKGVALIARHCDVLVGADQSGRNFANATRRSLPVSMSGQRPGSSASIAGLMIGGRSSKPNSGSQVRQRFRVT
jgi:hypothetical protein